MTNLGDVHKKTEVEIVRCIGLPVPEGAKSLRRKHKCREDDQPVEAERNDPFGSWQPHTQSPRFWTSGHAPVTSRALGRTDNQTGVYIDPAGAGAGTGTALSTKRGIPTYRSRT